MCIRYDILLSESRGQTIKFFPVLNKYEHYLLRVVSNALKCHGER